MNRYTRRVLVIRGAVAAGAIGAAPLLGRPVFAADAAPALSKDRRATYAALVEAVTLAKPRLLDAADVDTATDTFAAIYAHDIDSNRAAADATLDLLETGTGGDPFSTMSARARLTHLRGWLHGDRQAKTQKMPRRIAAVWALTLAARPFSPHGPNDPIPTLTI